MKWLTWDRLKSVFGLFGVLAMAFWTVAQYTTSVSFEAKRPFLIKQLELCFEASRTVATLAVTDDALSWDKARIRFWELYWGELAIVEDDEVAAAMVEFAPNLEGKIGANLPITDLAPEAIKFSHECRALIKKSW